MVDCENSTNHFSTQREKLRSLFDRRAGEWIPLPEIQGLGIAQHGARITELRAEYAPLGFLIENRMETGSDGIKRSWYRKVRQPIEKPRQDAPPTFKSDDEFCRDWYTRSTGQPRPAEPRRSEPTLFSKSSEAHR
jgi:hypothetical protein